MTIFKNQNPTKKTHPLTNICILTNRNPSPSNQMASAFRFSIIFRFSANLFFSKEEAQSPAWRSCKAPESGRIIRRIPLVKMQRSTACQSWHERMLSLQRCHSDKKTRLYYRSAIQDKHSNIIMIWFLISKKVLPKICINAHKPAPTQQIITNYSNSSHRSSTLTPCSFSKSPKSLAWNFFRELLSAITKVSWKRWDIKVQSVERQAFLVPPEHTPYTHPRKI